jgi:uncharacterized protein
MSLTPSIHHEDSPQQAPIGSHGNSSDVLSRIRSLDVLRGIAVLGAIFISIWIFGGYSNNEQNGLLIKAKGFNYWLYSTVNLLLHGKMPGLISIVFGASMILYLFRGTQLRQMVNAEFFVRRQMWLIAFGLINAFVFLWSGDVLFHLGIMGVLLFPFVRLSARGLLAAAILTTLIYSAKNYWSYADDRGTYDKYLAVIAAEKKITKDSLATAQKLIATRIAGKDSVPKVQKDTLSKKQKEEKQAWEGLVAGMKYDPKKDDGKNKAMRETSYAKIWDHQMQDTQSREAQWTYKTGIWEFSSMIFLGMALFRFGFFNDGFSRRKYLLIALVSLTIGLLLGWFRLHHNHVALVDYVKYIKRYPIPYHIFYPLEVAFTTLAYTSLVLWLLRVELLKHVWQGFATAGKMALTNYLMQSVICTIFFTGFGMGYFARLQQWQLYVFAAEVVLVNIVFSVLWLRSFNYGPAEWLWRCLIYKKWLPNRKMNFNIDTANAVS